MAAQIQTIASGSTIPPSETPTLPTSPSESSIIYTAFLGTEISDALANSCAELFSANYGVWGEGADSVSRFTKPGQRVKATGQRLRSQYISNPTRTVLVTCFHHTEPVGHVLATTWDYPGGTVGWVTQLVVSKTMRRRYIATHLLQTLKCHEAFADVNVVGLASTHPAACTALAKYAGVDVDKIDLPFIGANAEKILRAAPASYVKDAALRGRLFEKNPDPGVVSLANTKFFVDHDEPLRALETFQAKNKWCLGKLLDGHEFLVLFPVAPFRGH
ncbi:hypothetical protein BD779DRAFT_1502832 [Infundibulicybe gibba]|nr:hypothetical protein BD779DRAFT_1502832 [Infundibulicybe gibba]